MVGFAAGSLAQPSPWIAALFPAGVAAAELSTPGHSELLWEDERRSVVRAVPARVAEFAAGRHCAHCAMAQLGLDDAPLPAGADRAPQWPTGVIGSITHSGGFAAAVVARTELCAGLGLDAQVIAEMSPTLWRTFCTPAERRRLMALSPEDGRMAAAMCFAAKEAFYKCQYCLSQTWLDFDAVEIEWEGPLPQAGEFSVRLLTMSSPALACASAGSGRFCRRDDLVVAAVAIA
jgi:4'-phosphopantetheinyl transferase EntD